MNENKVTCLLVLVVLLVVYHLHQWITGDNLVDCPDELGREVCLSRALEPAAAAAAAVASVPPLSASALPSFRSAVAPVDACSVMDLLTLRASAPRRCRLRELRERLAAERKGEDDNPNAATVTVVMLLLLSVLKNVHDVMRSRREAALRQEREPEEQRRRSLAEFADRAEKKAHRFCDKPTLLQLSEPFLASRRAPHLARADSSNSYLAERPALDSPPPTRSSAADCTPPPAAEGKRLGSAVKLFGGRPAPLLMRRSSVPAMPHAAHAAYIPHNPALEQLRQDPRRLSICDSDDEADPRARRVRLIRRH